MTKLSSQTRRFCLPQTHWPDLLDNHLHVLVHQVCRDCLERHGKLDNVRCVGPDDGRGDRVDAVEVPCVEVVVELRDN